MGRLIPIRCPLLSRPWFLALARVAAVLAIGVLPAVVRPMAGVFRVRIVLSSRARILQERTAVVESSWPRWIPSRWFLRRIREEWIRWVDAGVRPTNPYGRIVEVQAERIVSCESAVARKAV